MEEEKKMLRIHNEISFALFSNLPDAVSIKKISEITGYNWRTVQNHLKMMSDSYKERNMTQLKGGD